MIDQESDVAEDTGLSENTGEGRAVTARSAEWQLRLDVDPAGIVAGLVLAGPPESPLVRHQDRLCRALAGLPLGEVARHGARRVLDLMVEAEGLSVPGIPLPANGGEDFRHLEVLLRQCRPMRADEVGMRPTSTWRALTAAEALDRVAMACRAWGNANPDSDVRVISLDPDIRGDLTRVVVSVSEAPVARQGSWLLDLERSLYDVEPTLRVYLAQREDLNRARAINEKR